MELFLSLPGKSKTGEDLLDYGSTRNFLSDQGCTALELQPQKEEKAEKLTLADGSEVMTEGRVQVTLRCGEYKEQFMTEFSYICTSR